MMKILLSKLFIILIPILFLSACMDTVTRLWNGGGASLSWNESKSNAWNQCSAQLGEENLNSYDMDLKMNECMKKKLE